MSGYLDVKYDALVGRPNYDWFVGSGYDGRIPTGIFANGFAFEDRHNANADADPLMHKNLPANRQNLYDAHREDGTPLGYYVFDYDRVAADMAPILPHRAMPGIDRIGTCIAGYRQLPMGHKLNSGVNVLHDRRHRLLDPGNPIGMLFTPPALGPYAKGQPSWVPPF